MGWTDLGTVTVEREWSYTPVFEGAQFVKLEHFNYPKTLIGLIAQADLDRTTFFEIRKIYSKPEAEILTLADPTFWASNKRLAFRTLSYYLGQSWQVRVSVWDDVTTVPVPVEQQAQSDIILGFI